MFPVIVLYYHCRGKKNGRHIAAIRSNVRLEVPLVLNSKTSEKQELMICESQLRSTLSWLVRVANSKLAETHRYEAANCFVCSVYEKCWN